MSTSVERPPPAAAPPVGTRPAAGPPGGTTPRRSSPAPSRRSWGPAWRSADILRAAALVMGLYLALRLLWLVHPLLLAAFLGVLFGLAVSRAASHLERFRIPRGVGSALTVFGFYGLLVALGVWSAPVLRQQFGELRERLPEAIEQVDDWLAAHRGGLMGQLLANAPAVTAPAAGEGATPAAGTGPGARDAGPAPAQPAAPRAGADARRPGTAAAGESAAPEEGSFEERAVQIRDNLANQLGAVTRYLFSFLSSTIAVVSGLLLITFIAIYTGSEPDLYRSGLLHLVPHHSRPRAAEVLTAIGTTLRKWLQTQLIAMVVIGVVTTIALMLLGVEAALSLGIIAGLLEFIPTVGPLLAAVPAVAMGFLDSPQKALMVAAALGGIQFLENHILIPLLMKQGVDLPPVLTILGQALMAIVFGFLGLLVAVPLMAAIMVAVKMLYVEDVVGDEVPILEAAPSG